ncbi:Acid protease [Mycena venus]|uniref:Acid protease n=1 Tax=Mycena venus TaxID=2733690 RepID=A0A8H7CZF8_9AGAR|nr:Acid protease [Mycena venus]
MFIYLDAMSWLSTISVLFLLGAANARFTFVQTPAPAPRAHQQVTPFPRAEFSIPFNSKAPRRKSKTAAFAAVRRLLSPTGDDNGTNVVALDVDRFEVDYLANITVGGQDFTVIVDTGSVDTWVIQQGFNCKDPNGTLVPQSTCAFGTAGYDTNASKTFQPFPDVNANMIFGNGAVLNGPVGFDTVAVGGLEVANQEIAVPNVATFNGHGIVSGLLGLAFPSLIIAVFNVSDGQKLPYDPFFFSAVKQEKLKDPIFSVSIDRVTVDQLANDNVTQNIGYLSFGGLPPVPILNTSVTLPIQGYSIVNSTAIPSNGPDAQFLFYTVDIQSYTFPGSTTVLTASNNTVLDTGTTFNILPEDVAAVFAAGFDPPATLITSPLNGRPIYVVDCNATAPEFLVTLGNTTFSIDPRDQVVPSAQFDNGTTVCTSGTQPITSLGDAFNMQFILGDVFLHNVVSTFNPISKEVTLTQRAKY